MPVVSGGGSSSLVGTQLDYVESTSGLTVTATTDGTAQTFITGNSVTYDGATRVLIEFWAVFGSALSGTGVITLYDGAGTIGWICEWGNTAAATISTMLYGARFLTPSAAAHIYTIKAFKTAGTVAIGAGAGGSAVEVPAWYRITRA